MSIPMISVVMPVYNAEKYVADAVESILNQTYSNFEFIIIDDCSTDSSYQILQSYASKDNRIKLYRNEVNNKQAYTKNRAIQMATGKYISFMDADDVSLPERFVKQIDFMEANPQIGLCGTKIQPFTSESTAISHHINTYEDHVDIMVSILFIHNVIIHPTVMIRSEIILSNLYDISAKNIAEDYQLWSRLIRNGILFHNLQELLLLYRVSQNQTTSLYRQEIECSARMVRFANVKHFFGMYLSDREIHIFINFYHQTKIKKIIWINKFNKIVNKIILINQRTLLFDVKHFDLLFNNVKPKYIARIRACIMNKIKVMFLK